MGARDDGSDIKACTVESHSREALTATRHERTASHKSPLKSSMHKSIKNEEKTRTMRSINIKKTKQDKLLHSGLASSERGEKDGDQDQENAQQKKDKDKDQDEQFNRFERYSRNTKGYINREHKSRFFVQNIENGFETRGYMRKWFQDFTTQEKDEDDYDSPEKSSAQIEMSP